VAGYGSSPMAIGRRGEMLASPIDGGTVTLIWFVVWLVANNIGDHAPLQADPVNWWAGALILAVALDLGKQHTPAGGRRRSHGA
jgi:hypothetical protein